MQRRGFTLIEVMVVLSILAIIAILGYNFFGSTMKEARLQADLTGVWKSFTVADNCYWHILDETGSFKAQGVDWSYCVDSGHVRDVPLTSGSLHTDGVAQRPYSYAGSYIGAAGNNDRFIWVSKVTEDACLAFNEKYTVHGSTIPSVTFGSDYIAITDASNPSCLLYPAGPEYRIMQAMEIIR